MPKRNGIDGYDIELFVFVVGVISDHSQFLNLPSSFGNELNEISRLAC